MQYRKSICLQIKKIYLRKKFCEMTWLTARQQHSKQHRAQSTEHRAQSTEHRGENRKHRKHREHRKQGAMLSTMSKPSVVAWLFFGGIGLHRAALKLKSSHSITTIAAAAATAVESSSSKTHARVKSSVYTKTGDKGISSVRYYLHLSSCSCICQMIWNSEFLESGYLSISEAIDTFFTALW